MAAALTPLVIDCPVCGESILLPARVCIDPERDVAQLLVSLDNAREHSREHDEITDGEAQPDASQHAVMSAVLAKFGVSW